MLGMMYKGGGREGKQEANQGRLGSRGRRMGAVSGGMSEDYSGQESLGAAELHTWWASAMSNFMVSFGGAFLLHEGVRGPSKKPGAGGSTDNDDDPCSSGVCDVQLCTQVSSGGSFHARVSRSEQRSHL